MSAEARNEVLLTGALVERAVLRYTPAGVPVLSFRMAHHSHQLELGVPLAVRCEVSAVALGQTARVLDGAPLGTQLMVRGFLAARARSTQTNVLHVTTVEFVEGSAHGIQAKEQDPG